MHVPASYDAGLPAPLLILLHGYTGSGQDIDAYFDLGPAAEARGFVYAFPDGTYDSDGNRFWNATDACCDFDRSGVDDVAYLTDVIADIPAELAIDPKRIALVGWSNGGFMSYRMACDQADLVAAMVSLAGATFADPADCAPSEPVSVAQIHGTADDVIRYEGGEPFTDTTGPYPGAETTAATWATYDCVARHRRRSARRSMSTWSSRMEPTRPRHRSRSGRDASQERRSSSGRSRTAAMGRRFHLVRRLVIDFLVADPKP